MLALVEKLKLTREEYEALKEKLHLMETVERPEIIERLQTARGYGDLSENAEYDAAKADRERIEDEINQLTQQLRHVEIVEVDENADTISIGITVRIEDLGLEEDDEDKIAVYRIVGGTADPFEKKISAESPVGKALLGRRPGDVVRVEIPRLGHAAGGTDKIDYRILEIVRTQKS